MADYHNIKKFILAHEGGYGNDPADSGGATNKGITIATFRAVFGKNKTVNDLKRMTDAQWDTVFKTLFWNKIQGDKITSEAIADQIVNFAWGSGVTRAVKYAQGILMIDADGVCGNMTVNALNRYDPRRFVLDYGNAYRRYLMQIAGIRPTDANMKLARTNPRLININASTDKDRKFIRGWLNRVNDLEKMCMTVL